MKLFIKSLPQLFLIVIVLVGFLLTLPVLKGEIRGTFLKNSIPVEYQELERFLHNEKTFSRVMWIPYSSRYSYFSLNHPIVQSQEYFKTTDLEEIIRELNNRNNIDTLAMSSIKYLIVPIDVDREIFLTDRSYDDAKRKDLLQSLDTNPFIVKLEQFDGITVYEIPQARALFWNDVTNKPLESEAISPVEYKVKNIKRGDRVVFTQSYDSGWKAISNDKEISPEILDKQFMKFVFPNNASEVKIVYTPQNFVTIGLAVSLVTLGLLGAFLFYKAYKTR